MPDLTPGAPPVEPSTPPVEPQQQEPATPVVTPPVAPVVIPPAVVTDPDWEARYKGSVLLVEELTIANRDHVTQQQAQTSEIERLTTALGTKDIEKTVAVSERDKNLEAALIVNAAQDTELVQLRAHKLKVDLANELGHPELITILDSIPTMIDPEVQKTVMMDFVNFREAGIQEREKALLSGVTPPVSPVISAPVMPTTAKGWQDKLNELPLGSAERQKVSDQWYDWMRQQG